MGYLNVTKISFQRGGSKMEEALQLEVKFDCLKQIDNEIEWRVVYVADPNDSSQDQVLDQIFMDSLDYGASSFEWEVPAPDYSRLASPFDVFDTAILMVIILIEGREFFRCSYLMSCEYASEEMRDNPPERVEWAHLHRKISANNPVITVNETVWEKLKTRQVNPQVVEASSDPRFEHYDMLGENK